MKPGAVVIGNFDGVHRGHQVVLEDLARQAAERALVPRVLTFDPHPAIVLGRTPPALLTTVERKQELLLRSCPGVEIVVRPFTREFAQQTPDEFAQRVLMAELSAAAVMVGLNFRFGRDRAGGIDDLRRLGEELGFSLLAEPLLSDEAGPWSSTRVRALVAAGDIAAARVMLGRPHMLSGVVARGDQRGRTIGFPTCNLGDVPEALPPFGVYVVAVDLVAGEKAEALAGGVANIGVRPTVGAKGPMVEVHLFDVARDLYGATLRVHLLERLRAEQKFAGLEALRAQIARDADEARAMLAGVHADPTAGGAWF